MNSSVPNWPPEHHKPIHSPQEIAMPELRPEQGESLSSGDDAVGASHQQFFAGLRSFLRDVRDSWRDPAIPPAAPSLRNYPARRP